jgi:hypothetical protein
MLRITLSGVALATVSSFISDVSCATQTLKPPREVWIAVRTDARSGQGTMADPYDGSTPVQFDARMGSFGPNTRIHLGRGTFQTAWDHTWMVKDRWIVEGTGMLSTTVQIVGRLTGHPGIGVKAFATTYDSGADGAVLKDFTIDCNWPGLANSADTGATVRAFTNTAPVTNSATIVSAQGAFTQLDVGRSIEGPGIPTSSWIGVVNSPTSIGISSSAVANVPVNARVASGTTITISEKNCTVTGAYIFGATNCKYDHIRLIHGYGTLANNHEAFMLGFAASFAIQGPYDHDATDNVISYCLAEKCYGNYGDPFALHGSASDYANHPTSHHVIRNSKVENCTAYGAQGPIGYQRLTAAGYVPLPGSASPFTSGGVNLADGKNITIQKNEFVDCQTIAYQDTGGFEGINVLDNTLIRGWAGVNFVVNPTAYPDKSFQGVKIIRNRIGIQRRTLGGANFAIVIRNDCAPVIEGNTITYDVTGPGNDVFWPLGLSGTGGSVRNNTIDGAEYVRIGDAGVTNGAPDSRYHVSHNRTRTGRTIVGMADTIPTAAP